FGLDQLQCRFPQPNLASSDRFAPLQGLGGNINHAGLPARIDMRQLFHSKRFRESAVPFRSLPAFPTLSLIESFQSRIAARICSATASLGFTNFGVNHGNVPTKSFVTRICPSHWGPEPIPMVGIGIAAVISL